MKTHATETKLRLLVVSGDRDLHDDFRKLLTHQPSAHPATDTNILSRCTLDSADQELEGLDLIERAVAAGQPYATALIDMGLLSRGDGVETIRKIWAIDPDVQLILCVAPADGARSALFEQLGCGNGWLMLKKPFEMQEALQLACALTEKWRLQRAHNALQKRVAEPTEFEQTLAYERDLLRTLLDNTPDHIYFKDAQSRFIKCSAAQALQFGVASADAMVGITDFDIFSDEHARPAFEDEQEVMRTGIPMVNKAERETWHDGRPDTWGLTTKMPLRNKEGQIIGTFGITKDISGIKQTEAELAYHRDLLDMLMNNFPDHIYFKDLQSRFVRLSRAGADYLFQMAVNRHRSAHPLAPAETLPLHLSSLEEFRNYLVGKSDTDFYNGESAARFIHGEQEIIRTGVPIVGQDEKAVGPDGEEAWHHTTKMPWHDKNGKTIGTFGISRDISELKRVQIKIEEVHQKLVEASRLAGMAEIATNVLHNVGNVLNSVNVCADVIRTQLRTSKLKGLTRAVGLMDEHASDLGEFVTRDARGKLLPGYLRELAQTLEGEHEAMGKELGLLCNSVDHIKQVVATQQSYAGAPRVMEAVRLSDLVDDALRMNAPALTRHKVDVVTHLAELPVLLLDRHRLLQILVNLIGNAKQAMNGAYEQSPCITLGSSLVEGRILRITVADNGEGIPTQNLTRVFAHGFTTRKEGHGFGLHSCVLAAQEMGGTLVAHSEGAGRGASFTLEIPVDIQKDRP